MKLTDPKQAVATVKQWMSQPRDEMNRWERAGQYVAELGKYVYGEVMADRVLEMGAALTYRTIFGLIPFFVLALIVFRGFGGFQEVGPDLQQRITSYLGISSISIRNTPAIGNNEGEEAFSTPGIDERTQQRQQQREQNAQAAGGSGSSGASSGSEDQPPDPALADTPANSDGGTPAEQGTGTSPPPGDAQTVQNPAGADNAVDQIDLQQIFADLNNRVANVDFKSIGLVGLALLIWAALSLVIGVEDGFNRIFQSTSGRSWLVRITMYWAVITLGPLMVALSLWLTGSVIDAIQNFFASGLGAEVDPGEVRETPSALFAFGLWVVSKIAQTITWLLGLLATVLLFFLLYLMMPNAKVRVRPALIGAVAAGLAWEVAKFGFRVYVEKAVGMSALYGTLGLIPLFLLWLYLTWLIVLIGLEITYTLQAMPQGRFQRLRASRDAATDTDPGWLIPLLVIIGRSFDDGEPVAEGELAGQTGLPLEKVKALCSRLQEAGILNRLESEDETLAGDEWALARPPHRIAIARILEIGDKLANERRERGSLPAWQVLEQLRHAQRAAVGEHTLAEVIVASNDRHSDHAFEDMLEADLARPTPA